MRFTKDPRASAGRPLAIGGLPLTPLLLALGVMPLCAQEINESAKTIRTSFELSQSGAISETTTEVGTWFARPGHAEIDDKHANSGKQCLHILGGEKRTIEFMPAEKGLTVGQIAFQAERWTRRTPFIFRIERLANGEWKEIYNGDQEVVIGSFRTSVRIDVDDPQIERLRFTCSSPSGSGFLLDDFELTPPIPQRVTTVEVEPVTLPAIVGVPNSPLLRIRIDVEGTKQPVMLTSLRANLDGTTDRGDIESIRVFLAGNQSTFRTDATTFGTPLDPQAELRFQGRAPLEPGPNYVWIAGNLVSTANIDHVVQAGCNEMAFSNGVRCVPTASTPMRPQRLGVAVRQHGDDGVHTFRIPGLATTDKGTLIGVYDVRRRSGGDLPGDIDIGMSRSTNGGRTWEPMKVIMDMGENPQWHYDGIGDPAVLVDQGTGTIWVEATWSHGNRSWRGSGPGLEPEETGQLMLVRSDDDGITWSKPINITIQVKRPEWCFILQGPGKGITMRDGTLVFAAQYQDPPEENRLPHSTIIYSKDHGETWHVGTRAFDDTTEAQVVELERGVLMLNCRYNRKATRVVMTTRDMGQTWQKHSTSERSLIEPRACMASLIDVDREIGKDAGGPLLFSNPDSINGRHHIAIKASRDRGLTWPKRYRLLLDEGSGRGYSCMSMIDQDTVGILYEGSQAHMTFQRIPLEEILGPQESLSQPETEPSQKTGDLRLPEIFGDRMVLQAESVIPVWGYAQPGEEVTVSLGHETHSATANDQGKWLVRFAPRRANAAATELSVQAASVRIRLTDILIGEVWVCAGQSNMAWTLSQSASAEQALDEAHLPQLRLLHLAGGASGNSGSYTPEHLSRLTPATFCQGQWEISSAETAASFSAVAWYFGRHLQQKLGVPIGLICPAVGGTPAEAWIPHEAMAGDQNFGKLVAGNWLDNEHLSEFCRLRGEQNLLRAIQAGETIPGDSSGPNHSFKPGFMWEAAIEPLIPFAIRGVIWYQGESNAESVARAVEHSRLFPFLINQWRQRWGQGDFPFLFVQLPAMNRPAWPWFREGQRRSLAAIDNAGMAITIDTGHPTNVHPAEKEPVGRRLATYALGTTYELDLVPSGPLVADARRDVGSITVTFDHVGSGLQTTDGATPHHFEICGNDGVFTHAVAAITDEHTVTVSSTRVTEPKYVRYAWQPFPSPSVNLINSQGIPASPFSTEDEASLNARQEAESIRGTAEDERPNVLLIVGEDHGCELSCYGDSVIDTPNIDHLAAEGVLFENGYVTQSVCSPSRSTIFTGLYPHQNGQLGLATHQYGWFKRWPTTYSLLKQAGYRTGLIGKTHVIPADAVESFVDFRFQPSANFAKRNVADYAVEAGKFFRDGDGPFFMTVNYPDAHWPLQGQVDGLPETQVDPSKIVVMPYIGHETPRLRQVVQNYYDCMLRLDACVGQLLKQLDDSGKADKTLVVFIGDHGAQVARGKVTVYEGGMRVPFLVRWPDIAEPQHRSKALVSTIDLLPTFMDAAGVPAPSGLPGKSLRAILGNGSSSREYLACERNCDAAIHTFPQRTIRDGRYKLIHSPVRDREDHAARYYRTHGASHWAGCLTDGELAGASERTKAGYARWLNPPEFQLYDLKTDPHEWEDLSDDPAYADTMRRLQNALRQWQAETNDPLADPDLLRRLMEENGAVVEDNRRWPEAGWQYLEYLHPDKWSAQSATD